MVFFILFREDPLTALLSISQHLSFHHHQTLINYTTSNFSFRCRSSQVCWRHIFQGMFDDKLENMLQLALSNKWVWKLFAGFLC